MATKEERKALRDATEANLQLAGRNGQLIDENQRLRDIVERLNKKVDDIMFEANRCIGLCAEALHG